VVNRFLRELPPEIAERGSEQVMHWEREEVGSAAGGSKTESKKAVGEAFDITNLSETTTRGGEKEIRRHHELRTVGPGTNMQGFTIMTKLNESQPMPGRNQQERNLRLTGGGTQPEGLSRGT